MWWVKAKHKFRIRDASQDRQPEIQSSLVREIFQRIMGQTSKDYRFRILILTILHASNLRLLEDEIQDWGFKISYGRYAEDQRIGVGWFSGWYLTRRLLQQWTESSLIPNSKGVSVWRNKKAQNRIVCFAEDRSLTWSTSISGSLEATIPSRIMPTYSLLVFEMTIFRNSIRNGTEFYCLWRKSHLMTSWKDCKN